MSKLYDILNSMITRLKKVETTEPDWSASEGEAGHVKNRTHYEEKVIGAIIENQTIEAGSEFENAKALPSVGQAYSVVFDGVTYECIAWFHNEFGSVTIGNGSLFEADGNGENVPFGIGFFAFPGGGVGAYLAANEGEHTVEVRGEMVVIHKLDAKFIPDSREIVEKTIAFEEDCYPITSAIINNTTIYFIPFGLCDLNTDDKFSLISGETYTLKAPTGKEYTVVAGCWGKGTPVSFFAEGDDGETYSFEDVGSSQQCLVYSGTGINVGFNTNEYSICGKFYKTPAIDVTEDTICVYAHVDRPWINDNHSINGKKVSHTSFIGWLCGDNVNSAKMEMLYGSGSMNVNEYAHPIRMFVTRNNNIIEDVTFTFLAYDFGTTSLVKQLDLINGKYLDLGPM